AFARGSAPEVVEDGVTGFLVHDEAELAERIGQLAYIDRARCRARARARWSHLRMAREYTELYEEVVRRSSPGSGLRAAGARACSARARGALPAPAAAPNRLRRLVRVVDDAPRSRDDQAVETRDESCDPSHLEAPRDRAECEAADARRIRRGM
ncbi:MAG TPA: hypothetical protein VG963_02300, partial [Polyangiaceae bacterium]|nr:hypothetical protein [Polyangiaceae bacterium]